MEAVFGLSDRLHDSPCNAGRHGALYSLFNVSLVPQVDATQMQYSNVVFGAAMLHTLLTGLSFAVLPTLYFILQEGSRHQATVGKRCLGIKVCDKQGAPLTRWRAAGRFFCKTVSNYTFLIGYIIAAFTPRKQALHDLMVETVVINAPRTDIVSTATNADAQAKAA